MDTIKTQGIYYFSSREKFAYILASGIPNAKSLGVKILGCKQTDIEACMKRPSIPAGYELTKVYQHKGVRAA